MNLLKFIESQIKWDGTIPTMMLFNKEGSIKRVVSEAEALSEELSDTQKMIQAIQIFEGYDSKMSFHYEHDSLAICSNVIDEETVSEDDILKLSDLGFLWSSEDFGWISWQSC